MPEKTQPTNPALTAATEAEALVRRCLEERQCFLLEAGAGAGKTYSLVEALRFLLSQEREKLRRNNQQIACITYTNVATSIISSRIDGDKLAFVDTIHTFCWGLIKSFQPTLRKLLPEIEKWKEIIAEGGELGDRPIEYKLGYRKIHDESVSIHHDDVLTLTAALMPFKKFQTIITSRFPYLLIDEYQDTSAVIMNAIKDHLFARTEGPLVGLFGDHWQRIYDETCGHVEDDNLEEIGKKANFRSAKPIVEMLNRMRPALPQAPKDPDSVGSIQVFHTNSFSGQRRSGRGGHWTNDLPATDAHRILQDCLNSLSVSGWQFDAEHTKILMLTHNILAAEQGYPSLAKVFPYNDLFLKKEDPYVKFFSEKLEPACAAYQERRYGEMFAVLGSDSPRIASHKDKELWSESMSNLFALREAGTIGDVLDRIDEAGVLALPDDVLDRERVARDWKDDPAVPVPELIQRSRGMRAIPYLEMIALHNFLEGHSPFSTKHGVKGEEYENVLVIFGRGWNKYDFDAYLTLALHPNAIPADKQEFFERNRNLFYVCCSRPKQRLALLFTQQLAVGSLQVLREWFGAGNIYDVGRDVFPALPKLDQT